MASFTFNTTRNPRLGKRERKTVSSSAVSITPATYTIAASAGATKYGANDKLASAAIIQVFTDAIYFTLDGTTPTSLIGFEAAAGDFIYLDSFQKVKDFKAIRKTTDATIEILPLFGA